jgi:uroporphyrinogen-III decarboxylase
MISRERVLAALDHRETDRIPIALVCGGINPSAMRELDTHLKQYRGIDAQSYIDSFLDVAEVWATGEFGQELDMWGVVRKDISYGQGSYSEIIQHPLLEKDSLQFSAANMGPQYLKDNFGDSLCFEGGMCVQKVLPFGSPEEIREETRKLISILGKNGGYLCGPSHFIQAGTPPENIIAFFDEAQEYYPFGSV